MRKAVLGILIFIVASASAALAQTNLPGLSRLAYEPANTLGSYDGVATFNGVMPAAAQLDALRALGLQVQGFNNLPLALLRGPQSALVAAVTNGIAADVYPNDQLHYLSYASDLAIRATEVQALGVDGKGAGVAVVDSGIDATHPDLAKRVTHNVKIIDPELATSMTQPQIIVPVDQGPYNDSDTTGGHGTHCAGIIAADNTDGQVLGVAPGASLIGYGTGDAVFIFSVLAAYDDIMTHHADWNIKVTSNSWGSSFSLFDPNDPINQATKIAHDAGITVVFAAGNDSTEMAINPYSVAPWVIGVGAGSLNHQRADFSSGGIEFDDSVLTTLPTTDEKHLAFTGDRIGLYHPAISAPGVNIVSTGTTGALVTSTPGGTASASGTSMACPHVAGVVALLLEKNPSLTPDEIKSVLEVTSTYMPDTSDSTKVQAFYQSGYGFVDAKAAYDLIVRHRYNRNTLARLQRSADDAVQRDRDYAVLRTDFWTFTAAPATVNGTPDNRTYTIPVTSTTAAIKALVSYPSLSYVGVNEFDYQLTLVDAAGKTVAQSTASSTAGTSEFFVDLTQGSYTFGNWTLNVSGNLGAQDQNTIMGSRVSLTVAQLQAQTRVPRTLPVFTATGTSAYFFTPGVATLGASPEGCTQQAGAPVAGLSSTRALGTCQSGQMGYAINYGAGVPADFTGAPLAAPLTVGGTMTLRYYLTDPLEPLWQAADNPRLDVEVDAVDADGNLLLAVGSGEWNLCNGTTCTSGASPVGGTYTAQIPALTLPAGSRISVLVTETGVVTSGSRTVYGGSGLTGNYGDAGITLTTGTLK